MSKYRITLNGRVYEMEVEILRDDGELTAEKPAETAAGTPVNTTVPAPDKTAGTSGDIGNAGRALGTGAVLSPMPGTVLKILLQAGEPVKQGQTVMVLEAMKMENDIQADRDGILREMLVSEGRTVSGNEPLFVIGD